MPRKEEYLGRFYFLKSDPTDLDWEVGSINEQASTITLRRWKGGTAENVETREVSYSDFETLYQCQQLDPLP